MNEESAQRRAYERTPFFSTARLTPANGGLGVDARTFDVSLGGVGLSINGLMLLRIGTLVTVAFRLDDHARGASEEIVIGRVARISADAGGVILGVEFLVPIRADTHPRLTKTVGRL